MMKSLDPKAYIVIIALYGHRLLDDEVPRPQGPHDDDDDDDDVYVPGGATPS